jgi:hypothetical protein
MNNRALRVKGVKESYFQMRDNLFVPDPTKLVKIELYNAVGLNTDIRMMNLMIGVYIHYDGSMERLADMQVNSFFELPFMDDYSREGNNVVLPADILIDAIGVSISHTRAFFFQRLAGTPFQQVIIPLDDPIVVVNHFFPHIVKKASEKSTITLQPG